MTDDLPWPSLEDHLAMAYDYFTHAKRGEWAPDALAAQISADPDLKAAADTKRRALIGVVQGRGELACYVSKIQLRALDAALNLVKP